MYAVNGYIHGNTALAFDTDISSFEGKKAIITILDENIERKIAIQKKIDAVNDAFGMLTPEESEIFDKSISNGLKFSGKIDL